MNVSLTPEFEQFVERMVTSGDFGSASEVVRAGLRLLKAQDEERRARLEALRRDVGTGVEQARRSQSSDGREAFARVRERGQRKGRDGGR